MITTLIGVVIGLVVTRKFAMELVSDGTLAGTVVGTIGMVAGAISGAALGFVVSTLFGVLLPVHQFTTTSLVQPLNEEGMFVQKGTRDNSRYYRFIDQAGDTQTVPLVQTSFLYTSGKQKLTTTSYVFNSPWEYWFSRPMVASTYHFDLNKLEPTNVVTASFN